MQTKTDLTFSEVDIRLAVGQPSGESPIKIICPMHRSRIGADDDKGSLAVYRKNVHCFGCGFHITRRYASLAFLTGDWDGMGGEDSPECYQAVKKVKERLEEFKSGQDSKRAKWIAPPPSKFEIEAFHRYLLRYQRSALEELQRKRGLSLETIRQFKLGHTGTHFTLPVPALCGDYETIRYRADDNFVDPDGEAYRKYEGKWGRNAPLLYPITTLRSLQDLGEEIWIVEGEFDALAGIEMGHPTLTITNGATSLTKLPEMLFSQFPDLHVNRFVLATDQDAAGEKAAEQLKSLLPGEVVRARWEGAKDLSELLSQGRKIHV